MKIVHVIPSLLKGGAERIVLDICNELQKMVDVECVLVTFRPDNAYSFLTDRIRWEIIPSTVIPSLKGKNVVEVDALQSFLDTFDPDVIHSHLFEAEIIMSQIQSSALRVVHFHDNMRQMKRMSWGKISKQAITDRYERKLVLDRLKTQRSIVIGISKDSLNYINEHLPEVIERKLLHNAIDSSLFHHPVQSKKEQHIVMIGSLTPLKAQELAIRAVQCLKLRGITPIFDIVGDGSERSKLIDQIADLNLENNVFLLGNLDHPESILKNASVYVHTSKSEAFGLALVEAMAAGLPVICCNGGGNTMLILEGKNGFLIEERNPELIADKLELLLTDEKLRLEMGRQAQEFSKQFDIVPYTQKLISIYKS